MAIPTNTIIGTNIGTSGPLPINSWQSNSSVSALASEYAIRGEMIHVSKSYSSDLLGILSPDAVKKEMLPMLVDELWKCGFIEFTKIEDVSNGIVKVQARIFATPDKQTRLIRLNIK
jgi:hypothetical protein